MKPFWKLLLFGLLIWLIPFVISFLIFSFHDTERALFESIMAVVVTASAVAFSILYLKKVEAGFLKQGILMGVVWLAISVLIDLPLFSAGPMAMSLADYMKDIGVTYLIIPTVAIGFGYLLQRKIT